jgi:acyl-CoA synthetase (AMP-forming)/AMP-acid ligase II
MFLIEDQRIDPGAPAILDAASGHAWSYQALRQELKRAAAHLPRTKCLVVVLVRHDAPSLLAYLSALAAGHAVLPLNATLNAELLGTVLATYEPEMVLAPADGAFAPLFETGRAYRARTGAPDGMCAWERPPSQHAVHPDLTLLLSTSGSTGNPKLVRLSRDNVLSNADSIRLALGVDHLERAYLTLPYSYSYGLSVIHSHLLAGACLVIPKATLLERPFWDGMRHHRCTSLACVPYMFEMLRRVGFEKADLPDLRTVTQAGGKLGDELILRFHRSLSARGAQLVVMYGQTEATARITTLPPERLPDKLGSVGFPIPGGSIRIVGDDGEALSPGAIGEVEYTGPNVMMGYGTSRADLARGDELGGVLRTGDVGYLDADGCVFIVGRRKRFSKVFGLRVSLDDVESQLHAAAPVAVVDGGERIIVCGTPASEVAVRERLKELSAQLHIPPASFLVHVVEAIPLLPSGKIDYRQLTQSLPGRGG